MKGRTPSGQHVQATGQPFGDHRNAVKALFSDTIALNRIRHIARTFSYGTGQDPEDLIQESFLKTLGGERNWNLEINLEVHLIGCIRSIASSKRKQARRNKTLKGVEVRDDRRSAEHAMIEQDLLDKITSLVAARSPQDVEVLDMLLKGRTREEIAKLLQLSPEEHDAIRRRIRQAVQGLAAIKKPPRTAIPTQPRRSPLARPS